MCRSRLPGICNQRSRRTSQRISGVPIQVLLDGRFFRSEATLPIVICGDELLAALKCVDEGGIEAAQSGNEHRQLECGSPGQIFDH